jgi:endonuclease/exonuclease/phosphatase (EEP) superfamily protein YafD
MAEASSLIGGRGLLLGAILLVALGVTAASLVSRLGGWFWPLDLLAHYQLQYAVLILVTVVVAAAARSAAVAGGLALLLALHLVPVAPLLLPGGGPDGTGSELRLVQINVLFDNERVDETVEWLSAQDADLIVAQETTEPWAIVLEAGLDGWRLLPTDTVRSDSFGMMVFARDGLDVESSEVHTVDDLPAIAVELRTADGPPTMVYAVHTLPPTSGRAVRVADEQLARAAAVLNEHDGPRIVIGDLNATRWGAAYRRLRSQIDLRDSADGQGLRGTWPSPLWFTGMIGIDHVLVSPDIRVEDRRVGPHLGSDHRAVVVDLTIVGGS